MTAGTVAAVVVPPAGPAGRDGVPVGMPVGMPVGATARDRANVEKHLAFCDAAPDPGHGVVWRRLATTLGRLAPLAVKTIGQGAVQFFVPDGRYRMQVFALEDRRDGHILVYLPDVLDAALRDRVLRPVPGTPTAGPDSGPEDVPDAGPEQGPVAVDYAVDGPDGPVLRVEALTAANAPDSPEHVKHLLGWNRKALRLTLPAAGAARLVPVVEGLCGIAARAWAVGASV